MYAGAVNVTVALAFPATAPTPVGASGGPASTLTGTSCGVVVELSPIWPESLAPQHCTPPTLMTAHVCDAPASTAATPLARPDTSVATRRCVLELSPSWPSALLPQHCTPPVPSNAHVCTAPAVIALTPDGQRLHRTVALGRGIVAELPVAVDAPALDRAADERARVLPAGCDRGCAGDAGDIGRA